MQVPLRTLMIEDSENDALLLVRHLTRGGYDVQWERIDSEAQVDSAAEANHWDLIICDYSMPGFNGLAALQRFRSRGSDTPFIFVSGTIGEEAAVNALRQGAQDYVMKDNLNRLIPAVARELKEGQDRRERKNLEKQVRRLEKFEGIGRLAGGIAHDFNNALGVIVGWAHLGFEEATDPKSKEKFQSIREQAQRTAGLTAQLLAFARRQVLQPRQLDINQLVQETNSILQPSLGEQVTSEVHLASDLELVAADPAQFQQVLINLSLNARDAMPHGGHLLFDTRNVFIDEAYQRQHPYARPGRYVRLMVADTGTGMDSATLEHMFEPFFTTKEPGKGTGLGLASVYGIVKQHGGFIDVESQPGKGTTFSIHFPVFTGKAEDVQPSLAEEDFSGTETILLAEDHVALAEIAAALLRMHGYTVVPTQSGDEALRLFQADPKRFDAVMLDVVMPGLSGPETFQRMLAIRSDLPCILTTGHTTESLQLPPEVAERVEYLQKPYDPATLAAFVRQVLDKKRPTHPGSNS
jgi:two-component system, cell cycle sensor histidine kinase and response regulator CckA